MGRFRTKAEIVKAIHDAPTAEGCVRLGFQVRTTGRHTYYAEGMWHYRQGYALVDCIGADGWENRTFETLSLLTMESLMKIYENLITFVRNDTKGNQRTIRAIPKTETKARQAVENEQGLLALAFVQEE